MISIVHAETADAAIIHALQQRAYASEARLYNDWTIPPLTQSVAEVRKEIESMTVLKAIDGETLVGSVRARQSGQTCFIGRLIVEPARQRQGIGSALLRAIEAAFPQATCFELFTGDRSEGNIRLYQRHGYAVIGEQKLLPSVTTLVLRKTATADTA